ncbi:hypothetical protein FDP41_003699 [Naegleria fowleri]|uniref:Phospholipase A2 domain-containing protein n=1 Tax=Naegleria fowleri TaxID=5763 RepID=A0A6A5BPT6_NAEFO|nr:uncharacterized protein FDP41_003699 [Naegleria fowleri]KAF0977046.1 hypothetical protein FDP41_003699 [Naegleria fowleri]CAG4713607.1 unnamed protein product [Naegleria fowleri]
MIKSSSFLLLFTIIIGIIICDLSSHHVNAKCPNLPSCKTPKPNFKPSYNGCGPRQSELMRRLGSILFDSFTPCCNEHDMCYETCGQVREDCDRKLYECMKSTCKKLYSSSFAKRSWCLVKAEGIKMGLEPDSDVACTAFAVAQQRGCDCPDDGDEE